MSKLGVVIKVSLATLLVTTFGAIEAEAALIQEAQGVKSAIDTKVR